MNRSTLKKTVRRMRFFTVCREEATSTALRRLLLIERAVNIVKTGSTGGAALSGAGGAAATMFRGPLQSATLYLACAILALLTFVATLLHQGFEISMRRTKAQVVHEALVSLGLDLENFEQEINGIDDKCLDDVFAELWRRYRDVNTQYGSGDPLAREEDRKGASEAAAARLRVGHERPW